MHRRAIGSDQDLKQRDVGRPISGTETPILTASRFLPPNPFTLFRIRHLVIVTVLGLAINLLYPLGISFLSLRHAAASAAEGKRALLEGELDVAEALFKEATVAARRAEELLKWPLPRLLGHLPSLRADYSTVIRISEAVPQVVGSVARALVEIREQLGLDPAASIYQGGRIQIDALGTLDGIVAEVTDDLSAAREHLVSSKADASPLQQVLGRALEMLDEDIRTAEEMRLGLGAAIKLLDADSTILLTFLSPSEARGGGGLFGTYALLEVTNGHLRLSDVEPSRKLLPPLRRDLPAPDWFRSLYARLGALRDPRIVNLSPTFSATAPLLADFVEARTSATIDAVVSMDSIVLGYLTRAIGPLKVEGWSVEINDQNVRRVLLEDIYQHFHGREGAQNGYLKNLVAEVMTRISEESIDSWELINVLADSIARQRVKVWARNPVTQRSLAAIGASGALDEEGAVHMSFNNNFSANKVDFYLHRRLDLTLQFVSSDTVVVKADVTLFNDVTDLAQTVMVRPGVNRGLPLGTNQMTFHTIVPEDAQDVRLYWDGVEADAFRGREAGRKVIWDIAQLDAGEETIATITYRLPINGIMNLILVPQGAARPDRFTIKALPSDHLCLSSPIGEPLPQINISGQLRTPLNLKMTQTTC